MQSPFEYIEGQNEDQTFQKIQSCCGDFWGCLKGWIPCCSCFCSCCQDPYQIVQQGNKGLLLRYQKYIKTLEPGMYYINSITERIEHIDCRITVIDLPKQRLMTKDNISIQIDSCCYYMIKQPHIATYRIQSLDMIIAKACGGILKNTNSFKAGHEQLMTSKSKSSPLSHTGEQKYIKFISKIIRYPLSFRCSLSRHQLPGEMLRVKSLTLKEMSKWRECLATNPKFQIQKLQFKSDISKLLKVQPGTKNQQ